MKGKKIKTGQIILAEPFMLDMNFKRAAVLLCEHGEEGSIGFIINKQLDMRVDDLIADFPSFKSGVYFGGPVQTDTIHFVHNVGDLLENSIQLSQGVYWGGDFEKLKFLIDSKLIHPRNIRFFVGYSGWTDGQLADEMALGSWVVADMDANYIFRSKPQTLWQKIMNKKGDAYTVIAQMPDAVTWN